MKKIFFFSAILSFMGFFLFSCGEDQLIEPDDGYTSVTNANPITSNADIVGKNFTIAEYVEGSAPQADTLYSGLNLAFSNAGQVFLSGGAYSSDGIWRLEEGNLSISGLGSIKGNPNGLNNAVDDQNPDGGWDTNKLSNGNVELFDNDLRKKFVLEEL